jgi:hypothetical protein
LAPYSNFEFTQKTQIFIGLLGNPVALKALMAQGADINSCGILLMQNADRNKLSDEQVYFAYVVKENYFPLFFLIIYVYIRRTDGARKEFSMPASATYGMNLLNYAVLGAAKDWKKTDLTPRMKTIATLLPLGINTKSGVYNRWTPLHTASRICQPELSKHSTSSII